MTGRLEGRVAIVTGGNSGIGAATGEVLAREGARVVLAARREEEGKAVEEQIRGAGGEATFVRCDVMDASQLDALVAAAVDRYGGVDVLFNNAGGGGGGEFPNEKDEHFDYVLRLNLTSTWRLTKAAWPHLVNSAAASVVNMSSYAAVSATPVDLRGMLPAVPPSAYAASKAGVEALTRYLASVGSPHGIRVNAVRPGQILTPMASFPEPGHHFAEKYFEHVQLTPGAGTPEDVGHMVLFLACDESRFVNGQILNIDGGAAGKV